MKFQPAIASMISSAASVNGLQPELVAAIAMKESRGDTRAVRSEPGWMYYCKTNGVPCHKDEVDSIAPITPDQERDYQSKSWGLVQVMGTVARQLGFRFADLSVLKVNSPLALGYGCKHLANFMRRHELVDAIACYNGGEGILHSEDPVLLATSKKYVSDVLNNFAIFAEQGF